MFYDTQSKVDQEKYKNMLNSIAMLSNLFSENDCPYLVYRAHENIFCRFLKAENIARIDCSADAKKNNVGIGLKTWTGNDDQKVAEFGKLKSKYSHLTGLELVKQIAEYRNSRIKTTMNMHGLNKMIYHIVKRIPNEMLIYECDFDFIDIDNIKLLPNRGNSNNTYFTDGKHIYHFSISKNTLYMIFDDIVLLDRVPVKILDDPFDLISKISTINILGEKNKVETDFSINTRDNQIVLSKKKEKLCLPLYSKRRNGEKFVAEKSGLNQWNAGGRARNDNELYIPYQAIDRNRNNNFFPARDTVFTLHLPDGKDISAKVCQEADKNNPLIGKAIMSNPNKLLGKWLLRDVLELKEGTIVTYDMLVEAGIDSVIITKNKELDYSIEFAQIGTYEYYYGEKVE